MIVWNLGGNHVDTSTAPKNYLSMSLVVWTGLLCGIFILPGIGKDISGT